MRLAHPFIQLPLTFDAPALAREVAAIPASHWRPHPQGFAGNSMLPLVAVGGDPGNEAFAGPMAPTPALLQCPYLQQVFASLGATIGRSRLMRLSGQAEVTRHADQGYYWAERVRVHVPIETQPGVRFECGDQVVNMAAGECWIFDTWRQHRVLNDDPRERIHLVVDTVGGGRFWELAAQGRVAERLNPHWTPQHVVQSANPAELPCERINVPPVMSPWEMKDHFQLLSASVERSPAFPRVEEVVGRFITNWHATWFRYGGEAEQQPHFRELLVGFLQEVKPAAKDVMLTNELTWYSAMMTIIARYAAGDLTAASSGAGKKSAGPTAPIPAQRIAQ